MYWKFKAFGRGYEDTEVTVEADRDLPHAGDIAEGDVLVRVDQYGAIRSISRVVSISETDALRPRHRCAICQSTNVTSREDGTGYCKDRKHREFRRDRQLSSEEVTLEHADVIRREFRVATAPLSSAIKDGVPETLITNKAKQQSIRPLESTADAWLWTRIPESRKLLEQPPELEVSSAKDTDSWADKVDIEGGRSDSVVRRRRNQGRYREEMIKRYGARCAVLGELPVEALDAAHIIPFAEAEEHLVTSGLLLAADIHRLFDRGLLILRREGDELRVKLAPSIHASARYAHLHDAKCPIQPEQLPDVKGLARHEKWALRRSAWS